MRLIAYVMCAALLTGSAWSLVGRTEPAGPAPPPTHAADGKDRRPVADITLQHDCGRMAEGDRAAHDFRFTNDGGADLSLQPNRDIKPNCGCTALRVEPATLKPGESATIRVEIDTTRRPGRFRHGGVISWHDPDGTVRTLAVTLSGEARAVVRCTPDRLDFNAADIAAGTTKEIQVVGSHPIDWAGVTFAVDDPQAFEVKLLASDATAARYGVRCQLRPGVESAAASGKIRGQGAAGSPEIAGRAFEVELALRAKREVELAVRPETVLLVPGPRPDRFTGRVMLHGNAVAADAKVLDGVNADGCDVEWAVRRPDGGSVVVLELTLTRRVGAAAPRVVTLSGRGRQLTLGVLWPEAGD